MERINTRIADIKDADQIARLNKLFNDIDLPKEHYASCLADPSRVETLILAEVDGKTAGFAGLRITPTILYQAPHAELTELFVIESFRRQGVGRALISHAEQMAREQGAKHIIVATDFYNHEAQELYRALGFAHHDIILSKKL